MTGNPIATAIERAPDAHPVEWPTLVPLDSPDLPRLDASALPEWAGRFATALAAATETPLELPAGMILAACATAAARRVEVQVQPGHIEPCCLWPAVALPPGNRKSAVQSAASRPLVEWEREQAETLEPERMRIASERKTLEARATALRKKAATAKTEADARQHAREAADLEADLPTVPTIPHLWTSDATPERLGGLLAEQGEHIAWLSSEGGVFDMLAGRYSNGLPNLDLVLKAWSGDPDRVDRTGREPVYLARPLLTIGLSPQPDVLRGLASRPGFRGRGLLGRFLYLLPPSPLGFRTLESRPVPDSVEAAYAAGLRAMLDWPARPEGHHVLRLEDAALREWRDYALHIEASMRSGGECEHATDWAGKAPGQAARIAGILHCIEHAHGRPWETPIPRNTMALALDLMAVFQRHSLSAMDLMGSDPTIAGARKVWEWIARDGRKRITRREIYKALQGSFPRVSDLQEPLSVLEERGYIATIPEGPEGPGRPSTVVLVRPDLEAGHGMA